MMETHGNYRVDADEVTQLIDSDEESDDAGRWETTDDEAEDDDEEERNVVRFVAQGKGG